MSEVDWYAVKDYRYEQKKPSWATHDWFESIISFTLLKDHWFWDLTTKEQEFFAVEGETSFLHHKHIVSKALKKARNSFTS